MKKTITAILMLCLFFTACNQSTKNETPNEMKSTIVKDPHSFARVEEAIVKHLSLDLNVDFNRKMISGNATLTIERKSDAGVIHLDTRGLTIDSIVSADDNTALKFELKSPVEFMGSELIVSLLPETKKIKIFYSSSQDAAALQWLAPEQTAGKKQPFLFTQSQAILARTWVPIQDSPGIRFTYDATIKVPKELMAAMSAENPQTKNAEGIYHFKMPKPIPAYLLALAVGDFAFKPLDNRTGVYAEQVTIDRAVYEFADLPKMVAAAENLYGDYAWGRYDLIVLPPSFPFGGMENPMLTFATPTILAGDRSLTSLVAHELAHSWSGNLVTNATWNDFWMNEGFTVYFELRIMEALYGKDFADMQSLLGLEDLKSTIADLGDTSADTHLKLHLDGRDPDDGMNDIAYEKGHFLLLLIEKNIGREKFDAFLKNYFHKHAFGTITTEQFIEEYKSDLIKGDTALENKINIEEWIYKPGLPSTCPVITSQKFINVAEQIDRLNKGSKAADLKTKDYSTFEWLRFIGLLPEKMSATQMKDLDDTFHFTASGNSEILFAWLEKAIACDYEPAYPALKEFLNHVGRRKFVKPLFAAMIKTENGKKMAQEIYKTARANYHSITQQTIDGMLN
jgi:leukotriene A-4 hydrolase/aminopeptidase